MDFSYNVYLSVAFIFGILIGSFLNVVIYRLPKMLEKNWCLDCQDFLGITIQGPFKWDNLLYPRSSCPHCSRIIPFYANIPILSFLFLKGRCLYCHGKIAWRYPFIELLTGFLFFILAFLFGLTLLTLALFVLFSGLIVIAVIDYDYQYIPDELSMPLLWLGLLVNLFPWGLCSLPDAVLGAVLGYSILWSIMKLFYYCTGKYGMGHGDFKLTALLGAWLGWQAVPSIIFFASIFGAIFGVALILFRGYTRDQAMAFGPFLIISAFLVLILG